MTAPDRITAAWTYMGRRLVGEKVRFAFLDDMGEQRWFAKLKVTVVGARYEVMCSPDRRTIFGEPRYKEPSDHPSTDEWRARDRAAWLELEARRLMRRAAADNADFGALTLGQYRAMVRAAPSMRRGALLAALLSYVET